MKIRTYGMYLAWVVALIGAFMSVYLGEVKGAVPCRFCWLQRMALFPLIFQLGIAAYREDLAARIYFYPLCFFGFVAAFFQALQPWLHLHKLCGVGSDCEQVLFLFGIVPFSWVSAIGFALIAFFLWLGRSR